ncbi:MAG: EAL domain-containing protein [Lachnospiraceae bacterium]|nr:EAL domain-containing protein [Lachnospiraceae bacterium]
MEAEKNIFEKVKRYVLIVEDEQINRELLGAIVSERYEVLYAADGEEAWNIIKEKGQIISVMLLDLVMPKMDGFELMKKVMENEDTRHIPIIVLTSEKSAEVKSLNMGASDFITKPYDMPEVILARINRIIEHSENRSIIKSTERDELTGLFSRNFFYEYILVIRRLNEDREMDAIAINIDHFHLINEIYGRNYGDMVLKTIAKTLKSYARENDGIAARVEADTFYLYAKHRDDYGDLSSRIGEDMNEISKTVHAHVRIGIYPEKKTDTDIENMFDRAKLACNTIRGKFRESVAFYNDELHENVFFSERLIHDMYEGIEKKQFKVYFQPKYDIQENEPVLRSAEALIRWQHPEFGMISPGAFISLFEENGLIQKIDHFIWKEAASNVRKWRDKYGVTLPVSVNVSRIDIYDPEIESRIMNILNEFDLKPADLHLEITESAYADNAEQLVEMVRNFRKKGFIIEMDDFGAGYSSLNMLSTVPIDVLKLDMKFVRNMNKDEKSMRMIELIMDIAGFLSVPVVAEGVENEEQYRLLKDAGCELIQGYYFSKPVPPEEFEEFVKKLADK